MSDEPTNTDVTPADVTPQNGSPAPSNNHPETVPYERFREVNEAQKALQAELQEFKSQQQKAQEEEAKKKGEFEKLYNDNLSKIEGYDTLNQTLESILKAQVEKIPEDKRSLIPSDYPPYKQLEWINANQSVLSGTASKNSPVQPNEKAEGKIYHKASDIQKLEYYNKNEADIKLAMIEGRIVD